MQKSSHDGAGKEFVWGLNVFFSSSDQLLIINLKKKKYFVLCILNAVSYALFCQIKNDDEEEDEQNFMNAI